LKRPISLRPRLLAAAGWIRETDRVADVGTDHARLPVYLVQQKLAQLVIGLDRAPGPLARAQEFLQIHGLEEQIPLLLSDGLQALNPHQIDTAVITGLGGETILGIVKAAPWLREKRLIIGPQTHREELLQGLAEMGFFLSQERDVSENGRVYHLYLFDK